MQPRPAPSRTPLKDRAQNRWTGILPAIGIPGTFLTGKHCPCPMCGGKDRFRFDNKEGRGTWFCSQCGAGDGAELVMRKTGLDFREAAQRIESVLGHAAQERPKIERSARQIREERNNLWLGAKAVHADDIVARYLASRGLDATSWPPCLRTALRVLYKAEPSSFHPVMLAMVHGDDGRPATLHRTYLDEPGEKANVEQPRRIMPGPHPKGSAVRLAEHGPVLGIAEGIETALAAARLFEIPCWAALNAGMLEAWTPPDGVTEVFVFGDNDPSFTGQDAAFGLARRLTAKGVRTRVEIPVYGGTDWNDELRNRMGRKKVANE